MIRRAFNYLALMTAFSSSVAVAQPRDPSGLLGIRIGWALSSGASVLKLAENSSESTLFNQIVNSGYAVDGSDAGVYLFHEQSTVAARVVQDLCAVNSSVPTNILLQGAHSISFEAHNEPAGQEFDNPLVPENPEEPEPDPEPAPIIDFVGLPSFSSLSGSGHTFIAAIKPITQGAALSAPGPKIYEYLSGRGIITNDNFYRLGGELTIARIAGSASSDDPMITEQELLELSQICALKNAQNPIDAESFTTTFAKGVVYGLSSTPATPTPVPTPTPTPTGTIEVRPTAGSDLHLICYEGRTHELPEFLLSQYLNEYGASLGACVAPTATPSPLIPCLKNNLSARVQFNWAAFDQFLMANLVTQGSGTYWYTFLRTINHIPPLSCVRSRNIEAGLAPYLSLLERKQNFVCSQITSLGWADGGLAESWNWFRIKLVGTTWTGTTRLASLVRAKLQITTAVRARFATISSSFPDCWSNYRALNSIGLAPEEAVRQYRCANPTCPDYPVVNKPPVVCP